MSSFSQTIRPMLAASEVPSAERLRFPLWAQPKYDGVRALCNGEFFQARSGKPLANKLLRPMAECLPSGLDGELIIAPGYGPQTCNRTSGIVNSNSHNIGDLIYILYDLYDSRAPYIERNRRLFALAPKLPSWVHITESRAINNLRELLSYEEACLAKGYEGLILRNPRSAYKHGRCTVSDFRLSKWVQWHRSEAICIGVEEQMQNLNPLERTPLGYAERSSAADGKIPSGMLGAFICKWRAPDNAVHEIRLGTGEGLTHSDRVALLANPPIGKALTFKYKPAGQVRLPRSPIFIAIREDI